MKKADSEEFIRRLSEDIPAPATELKYKNSYTLLIAVVLSAQATDVSVIKATRNLFIKYYTPAKILDLGEKGLKQYIRTIGLYNTKAKNIIALSKMLIECHDGQVPDNRQALEALPGVGRKTAGVVLNEAFGRPTIAVDTHIFRVSNRTGLAIGKTPNEVEKKLYKVLPDEFIQHAHHWLILFGRYVCTARSPKCSQCSVYDLCSFKGKE